MPWAWLIGNYKVVTVAALVAATFGYIWYLRGDIARHDREVAALQKNLATADADIAKAQAAIKAMESGLQQYQTFVNEALDALKSVQIRIARENQNLGARLDNVIKDRAIKAERIKDAPIIPFWDNTSSGGDIRIGVNDGVYHYRMRSHPGS